jgi:CHAT domain-containing protein
VLVGGVDYGPEGKWSYLKGTAAEVEHLAKLRPGPGTVRLDGASATKSSLRALLPGRRYIHLATHGEFLDPGPRRDGGRFLVTDTGSGGALFDVTARSPLLLSMLVLAGANRSVPTDPGGLPIASDGLLTAEEVMGLDLSRTELVVLSACETGVGKVRGGEGVFSLQRAFHIAGTRAVVASLWAVDDRATQALMSRFYRNLWADQGKPLGKLEALREAQLWLLHEGAKELGRPRGGLVRPDPVPQGPLPPSYWAAFVLSGDWR